MSAAADDDPPERRCLRLCETERDFYERCSPELPVTKLNDFYALSCLVNREERISVRLKNDPPLTFLAKSAVLESAPPW